MSKRVLELFKFSLIYLHLKKFKPIKKQLFYLYL